MLPLKSVSGYLVRFFCFR